MVTPGAQRILVVSSEYPPHVFGGLGVHVAHLTAALAAGAAVDLLLPRCGDYAAAPGIRLHEVEVAGAEGHLEFWDRFCTAAARAAEERCLAPDLVHCHDWLTIEAGVELKRSLDCPLVYTVHLPQTEPEALARENRGLDSADLVIVNSEAVRREIEARGLPLRRLEVVPNGVDLETFRPARTPPEPGYVLFVGRLVPQKGVETLLRAFAVLLQRCPESRLVIAGDGELELALQRIARHLGISGRVSFAGWRTGADLAQLYRRAQVVAVPSWYEPFGIVALEAMACGTPVVASAVGGLAEVIQDGKQGFLVEAGDHLGLAQRLAKVLRDPARRRALGQAARRRAEEYSWRRIAERTRGLFASLPARVLATAGGGG